MFNKWQPEKYVKHAQKIFAGWKLYKNQTPLVSKSVLRLPVAKITATVSKSTKIEQTKFGTRER